MRPSISFISGARHDGHYHLSELRDTGSPEARRDVPCMSTRYSSARAGADCRAKYFIGSSRTASRNNRVRNCRIKVSDLPQGPPSKF